MGRVRDLIKPGKEPEKPVGSQFILTDIFGNRSSNVTVECMREQLKRLMENERAVLFQLQILPPLTVQELGKLNCILCMYHNAFMLSAFFDREEGEYGRYHINAGQSEAEEWFEKLLAGNPDFSGWKK